MGHGAPLTQLFLWSHHEKIVVIDQCVAFVGGMDLCVGRYDDDNYTLLDASIADLKRAELGDSYTPTDKENTTFTSGQEGYMWTHKDYNNSMKHTFNDPGNYHITDLNRGSTTRGPWQDIGSCVYGNAAYDLGRHFIQRWNFTKKQNYAGAGNYNILNYLVPLDKNTLKQRVQEYTSDSKWIQPPNEESRGREIPKPFQCKVQPLRSLGAWSGGLSQTEHSIQSTYINLIQQAEDFVYIENQFFCTTVQEDDEGRGLSKKERQGNSYIENGIGQAIVQRIKRAHTEGKPIKFYREVGKR